MITTNKYPWWETGIIYQIYPRSFQDSNGDGIGDLKGIQSRLPYLENLGVTAIWLSPIYPSPMVDFGYDVSDYTDIHPIFGTMDGFMQLLNEVHQRGMKLILDFVPNHTSDQHPWFVKSRSSRNNPKRSWYIWKDPKPDGSPPNNWQSYFGGSSAWEWDQQTGQYYLRLFTKAQPDLNWRNPEVVRTMLDVLRFWLERGVDGFRVDVISLLIKDAHFRDEPYVPDPATASEDELMQSHTRTEDQPEGHDIIRQMRRVLDDYGNRVLIGELWYPYEKLVTYYGKNLDECHLPFNFGLLKYPFTCQNVMKLIYEYENALPKGAWPNWVLGNHDRDRIASECRAGSANARLAQMLLLTLRGTPTMYYGDELGMPNVEILPAKFQDPMAAGIGRSRDFERTPMQWDDTPYAGFSKVKPWLPVADDYASRNVKIQEADPHSMFQLVKQLISIRQTSPALNHGNYIPMTVFERDIIAYLRTQDEENVLIVLNFSDAEKVINLSANSQKSQTILLSTHVDRHDEVSLNALKIRPHEGLMIRVSRF
jgi:alpha-glucosidase